MIKSFLSLLLGVSSIIPSIFNLANIVLFASKTELNSSRRTLSFPSSFKFFKSILLYSLDISLLLLFKSEHDLLSKLLSADYLSDLICLSIELLFDLELFNFLFNGDLPLSILSFEFSLFYITFFAFDDAVFF